MKRSVFLLAMLFGVLCSLGQLEPAHATVTWSGDLNPADPTEWTLGTYGYVGDRGSGALSVTNGSGVMTGYGHIGSSPGATGLVAVEGAGSTWMNSRELHVGRYGSGILNVTGGGAVTSGDFSYVGVQADSTGQVTVDGAGSTWTNQGSLYVGCSGYGTLTITNGGAVRDLRGFVGDNSGSTGNVTVDGIGSTWTNDLRLYLGYHGSGTLNVANGGLVSVGERMSMYYNGGDGGFVNMSTGGVLTLLGDADDSLASFLDLIVGTDAIRYWDDSMRNWANITSATPGVDYTLTYIDDSSSDLYGYTALTVGTVPEPSTLVLMGLGAAGLLFRILGRRDNSGSLRNPWDCSLRGRNRLGQRATPCNRSRGEGE
ncbi:MAG: PEP-CTERM sorting domain-containing protein [Pirellulales bacterium]|nr:PEP-CTERM sorting domain-containing protein [Pirellulales bacterium]